MGYENMFMLSAKTLELVEVDNELVDMIWTKDRPERPNESLMIHTLEYTGKSDTVLNTSIQR